MTETDPELHTYMIQRHWMRLDWPLRFSDGERIVAVLESESAAGPTADRYVTVLVELPEGAGPASTEKTPESETP